MAGSDTRLVAPRGPTTSSFRPDIEGLRAVAIGLVLIYHAGIKYVPGGFVGVDVFFVISGFLITGLLIREVERTGRVSLSQFWARRAKRLLPASALALVATAIASWLVVPATHWRDFGGDVSAAALYVVNWRFAAQAIDYNAEGAGVSPVLHFWSLAVEEQFYLVWPLLIVAVVVLARRWRRAQLRVVLAVAIAAVIVPSFLWSIAFTSTDPDVAFFVTTTRLWELGIGAAVAIGAKLWPRIPGPIALALGWLGVAAIVFAALQFTSETPWPGAGALVPTLGTAAVIVATTGRAYGTLGVGRLLGLRPMVWIGGLSYSLYLWHWPFLVLGAAHFGELRNRHAVLLVLASGIVAWLSLKLVENPIRFSRPIAASPRLALSLGGNFTLLGALAGAVLVLSIPATTTAATSATPGARFLDTREYQALTVELSEIDTTDLLVPSPTDAYADQPASELRDCVTRLDSREVLPCEFGDTHSDITVALVGDSKVGQWFTALKSIASDEGWRLVTYLKSACAFAEPTVTTDEERHRLCADWNRDALEAVLRDSPDVVLTSGFRILSGRAGDDYSPGARRTATWWSRLADAGIPVLPLLDNPLPPFDVPECVAEHMKHLSDCAFDRDSAIEDSGARYQILAAELTGVDDFVDMTDIVCPGTGRCPAVIGNVLLYRQGSHLTKTFVDSATQALDKKLVPLVNAAAGR